MGLLRLLAAFQAFDRWAPFLLPPSPSHLDADTAKGHAYMMSTNWTPRLQRFRVRQGLSCVIGPVRPVGASCYSQAALPMPLSKPLYKELSCLLTHIFALPRPS